MRLKKNPGLQISCNNTSRIFFNITFTGQAIKLNYDAPAVYTRHDDAQPAMSWGREEGGGGRGWGVHRFSEMVCSIRNFCYSKGWDSLYSFSRVKSFEDILSRESGRVRSNLLCVPSFHPAHFESSLPLIPWLSGHIHRQTSVAASKQTYLQLCV